MLIPEKLIDALKKLLSSDKSGSLTIHYSPKDKDIDITTQIKEKIKGNGK